MERVQADIDITTAQDVTATSDITTAILSTICGDDDGCYRRAAQRVVTTVAPSMLPASSTSIPSHKMNCTQLEISDVNCQNGGVCFATKLGEARHVACRCPDGYEGTHCEYIEIPTFEVKQYQIRTAHIAAGLSVFVLIVFALLLALYVWHRLHKRNPASNTEECDPLNEKGKIPPDTTVAAHPLTASALNSTSGGSSVNGVNSSVTNHPEEISLTVMDESTDHNKQLGPSDAS